jgi:hypothetical protein
MDHLAGLRRNSALREIKAVGDQIAGQCLQTSATARALTQAQPPNTLNCRCPCGTHGNAVPSATTSLDHAEDGASDLAC